MVRNREGEAGQALVLVTMVVAIAIVVASALVTLGTGAVRVARAHTDDVKAYYIAEAGMERALAQLRLQPSWEGFVGNWEGFDPADGSVAFGGGKYAFEVAAGEWDSNMRREVTITSVGSYGSAQKTLVMPVRVELHEAVWNWPGLFVDGTTTQSWLGSLSLEITDEILENIGKVFVRGSLSVGGNARLTGNSLHVLGDLSVSGNARVIMNEVKVGGSITGPINDPSGKGIQVPTPGDCQSGLDPFPGEPPEVLTEQMLQYYNDLVQDEYLTTWDSSHLSSLEGIYRHVGDLTLSGEYAGYGTIIATGNITITRNLTKTTGASGSLRLISLGEQVKVQTCTLEADVIARKLCLNGNAGLKGTVIAQNVVLSGGGNGVNFEYDPGRILTNGMALPGTEVKILGWREKYGVF
ncbi:pilus assembly PilX N-terminal domain-containing protein [Candidatus Desulforudis audaxviator]|uniref:Type 4 fimbrial biogenesis protein PilX N-terminal domain-containing protein n=1 Tax=Desulforudis audaxviator (strain MP104C) TaxID=477974 RepID=B1I3E1_DESAP|nr:pilus assembly PilX N-terminal domain-containing protein [Candidatus Desulforudis audaxviator]ACA59486.1 hypothetical protein Daud_0974 [Candidatus Desulforudis audaxviator MP104C]AZK59469.1 PilX prepilin-like protein [Candidatus Desulforudis audaxviator]